MISAIQEFFRTRVSADQAAGPDERGLQLATAALMFEMLRADHEEHPQERQALETALCTCFDISDEESRELAAIADHEAHNAVSLYQFTALINERFTAQQKVQVVEMLWQVAYADGHLDPYEEALVRKIADLMYVPHRDFIQAKHRVQESE